jgi:hypothetical protein
MVNNSTNIKKLTMGTDINKRAQSLYRFVPLKKTTYYYKINVNINKDSKIVGKITKTSENNYLY